MNFLRFTKIVPHGTSMCVIIPANILRAMGLNRGDLLAVATYDDGVITLRRLSDSDIAQLKPPTINYAQNP